MDAGTYFGTAGGERSPMRLHSDPSGSSMPVFAAEAYGRVGVQFARRRASLFVIQRTVEELASIGEFAGGEVGADLHRGSAPWAVPTGRGGSGLWTHLLRLRGDREQLSAKRQISCPVASRQETILPNADEATRQNVLGEAPQKVRRLESRSVYADEAAGFDPRCAECSENRSPPPDASGRPQPQEVWLRWSGTAGHRALQGCTGKADSVHAGW